MAQRRCLHNLAQSLTASRVAQRGRCIFNATPLSLNGHIRSRAFATATVALKELSEGNYLLTPEGVLGRVVTGPKRKQQGRAQPVVSVEWQEVFGEHRILTRRGGPDETVTKVTPDRAEVSFMYIDYGTKSVIAADDTFTELSVPFRHFPGGSVELFQVGDKFGLIKHEDAILSVAIPATLASQARAARTSGKA